MPWQTRYWGRRERHAGAAPTRMYCARGGCRRQSADAPGGVACDGGGGRPGWHPGAGQEHHRHGRQGDADLAHHRDRDLHGPARRQARAAEPARPGDPGERRLEGRGRELLPAARAGGPEGSRLPGRGMTSAVAPAPTRTGRALATVCGVLFLTFLDTTIVAVTLGDVQSDLHAGVTALQWVVNAYALVFASLMLTGGSLGDRLGRKRVMLVGLGVFAAGSLLGALASSVGGLLAAAARLVPESADPRPGGVDVPGFLLGAVALAAVIFAVIGGEDAGYRAGWVVALFAVGAIALPAFLLVESRSRAPMLDPRYFRLPGFSGPLVVAFAVYFGVFSIFFFTALYLEVVVGYSGYRTAGQFAPMAVAMVGGSLLTGRWVARSGGRIPMVTGCLLAAAGILLTARYLGR